MILVSQRICRKHLQRDNAHGSSVLIAGGGGGYQQPSQRLTTMVLMDPAFGGGYAGLTLSKVLLLKVDGGGGYNRGAGDSCW